MSKKPESSKSIIDLVLIIGFIIVGFLITNWPIYTKNDYILLLILIIILIAIIYALGRRSSS